MPKRSDWIWDVVGMAVVAIWEAVKGLPELASTRTEIRVANGSAICTKGSANSSALREIASVVPRDKTATIRETVDGKWLFSGVPEEVEQRIRNIIRSH